MYRLYIVGIFISYHSVQQYFMYVKKGGKLAGIIDCISGKDWLSTSRGCKLIQIFGALRGEKRVYGVETMYASLQATVRRRLPFKNSF